MIEEKMGEGEARFRSAFDDVAVGMSLADPESKRYLRVNPALCEMFGYPEEELLQMTFLDFTHPEDIEATLDYGRRMIEGEIDSYQHEKRYVCADCRVIWALDPCLCRTGCGRPSFVLRRPDARHHRAQAGRERFGREP